jgi:hypothetical protein
MDKSIYTGRRGESKPDDWSFEDAVRFAVEDWVAGRICLEEISSAIDLYAHNLNLAYGAAVADTA